MVGIPALGCLCPSHGLRSCGVCVMGSTPAKGVGARNPRNYLNNVLSKSCLLVSRAPKNWPLLARKTTVKCEKPVLH